ncbi:hypothetical protein D3C78_1644000 [compost metagenome]
MALAWPSRTRCSISGIDAAGWISKCSPALAAMRSSKSATMPRRFCSESKKVTGARDWSTVSTGLGCWPSQCCSRGVRVSSWPAME